MYMNVITFKFIFTEPFVIVIKQIRPLKFKIIFKMVEVTDQAGFTPTDAEQALIA